MFKGVFFQHLGYFLADIAVLERLPLSTQENLLRKYTNFVKANAHAVWEIARDQDGKVGNWWAVPPGDQLQRQLSVETHGSGVAAVCCAVRLDRLLEWVEQTKPDSERLEG